MWVRNKVCAIGEEEYETLEDALAAALEGEETTISLLKTIDHNQSIVLDNQKITFELNGFILNVYSWDEDHPALEVINGGRVVLSGKGELNVNGKNYRVFVSSETTPSAVTVTSAEATAAVELLLMRTVTLLSLFWKICIHHKMGAMAQLPMIRHTFIGGTGGGCKKA